MSQVNLRPRSEPNFFTIENKNNYDVYVKAPDQTELEVLFKGFTSERYNALGKYEVLDSISPSAAEIFFYVTIETQNDAKVLTISPGSRPDGGYFEVRTTLV